MHPSGITNWTQLYNATEIRPETLGKIIKPGQRIYLGSACSEPLIFTNFLVQNQNLFTDCQILHFFNVSNQPFFNDSAPASFRHNTISIIGNSQIRNAINLGKSDYTPIMSSEIPSMIRGTRNRIHVDVALIQTSVPDRNGYCSLGMNVDINQIVVEMADVVIAQVNPRMPYTMGNSMIRFKDIDYFMLVDSPLLEYPSPKIDETTKSIAQYVARLIENGSTLNLGLGKIPYLLPHYLTEKKDLALYSELIPDSILPLIEKEVINCKENAYPHCMTSFALGNQKFYEYIDRNPFMEFHPTEFIMNINNMMRNKKLCSVYSAMRVDLLGQATNHLGTSYFSGIGGEPDFIRGSKLSQGGKSIIALPSLTSNGESRIVPVLPPGPITLRDFDIHYVVTEWGIAYLYGRSVRDRALQLIGIAHPKYRPMLLQAAKQYHLIYSDQILPETQDGVVVIYPNATEFVYKTNDGQDISFRPLKPTDERLLQELYYNLSEEDRVMRFMTAQKTFSHEETQSRLNLDYQNNMMLGAFIGTEEDQKLIAAGGYFLNQNTNLAEIAVTTDAKYRKIGIARKMFLKLIEYAQMRGIAGIYGEVYANNQPLLRIIKSLPYQIVLEDYGETLEFYCYFHA